MHPLNCSKCGKEARSHIRHGSFVWCLECYRNQKEDPIRRIIKEELEIFKKEVEQMINNALDTERGSMWGEEND